MKFIFKNSKLLALSLAVCLLVIPVTTYAVSEGAEASETDTGSLADESSASVSEMPDVSQIEDISGAGEQESQQVSEESSTTDTSLSDESDSDIVIKDEEYVRVGIYIDDNTATKYTISSQTGFEYGYSDDVYFSKVGDTSTKTVTVVSSGAKTVQLYDSSGKFIYEYAESDGKALAIRAKDYAVLTPESPRLNSSAKYTYEGYFEFPRVSSSSGSAMRLINVVDLETYVLCVLPCEIGSGAKLEAMKAQVLCIRSFVMSSEISTKHKSCNICATSNCQVYYGTYKLDLTRAASESRYNMMVAAVYETKGDYMIYTGTGKMNGAIVQATYHSSSGGSTVSAASFWGSSSMPYCSAVTIPEETNYYTWGASVVTLEEIYKATKLDDFKNTTSAWKKEIYSLAKIESLEVLEFEKNSEHVIKMKLTDVNGKEVILTRGDRVYYFIHRVILCCESYYKSTKTTILSSTNFTLTPIDQTALDIRLQTGNGDKEISSSEPITVITGNGKVEYDIPGSITVITGAGAEKANLTSDVAGYKLVGKGWAHCVGLGQNGAIELDSAGYNYKQILNRYFADITIVNIQDTGYTFSYDN